MNDWTKVSVFPVTGGNALLDNGTGSGTMAEFACSTFPNDSLPAAGTDYTISAIPPDAVDPMDWTATCSYSGTISVFTQS
ncbi:hypothetical protein FE840_009615 [Peteryoungia desertarenae]|uniref:Uncharacterized protein n=1 Tax=Peteryoungia desertarenae TaxID=1813451 RepID=A0ABX6QNH3_9HYPH|nr:hypothetical protein [Peteryoungia desertarenae]QLF69780.1 hypothetical protein FE840_009615 [Peteryoungia desertarenae]